MNNIDHAASGLTTEATFRAMVIFTTRMGGLGWPSLPGLLGGVQLIEGRPSDPGVEDDWAEVIATLGADDFSSNDGSLPPQAAYEVVFRFLALQYRRRGLEGINDVVERLGPAASVEQVSEVTEDWNDALAGN